MVVLSQFLKRFDITRRKKFYAYFTFGLTTCGLCSYVVVQNFCVERYVKAMSFYRWMQPYPVPADLQSLADSVLQDYPLQEYRKKFVHFFMVYGFDTFYAGSVNLNNGGYVGLPINFIFKSTNDVDLERININFKPVPWSSKHGSDLCDSLVLSEEAQKYAIAREIYHLTCSHVYWKGGLCGLSTVLTYIMARQLNMKMNLYHRPVSLRALVNSLVISLGIIVFWSIKHEIQKIYKKNADRFVAKLGRSYVNGGVEYSDKMIKRNNAFKAISTMQGNFWNPFMQTDSSFLIWSKSFFMSQKETTS